jgi:hypothetical protein
MITRLMLAFLAALLLTGCGRSKSAFPGTYSLAELRKPHDMIDGVVRGPDTIVLVSFFANGNTGSAMRIVTMRNGKTSQAGFSKDFGQHGMLPAGRVAGPTIPTPAYPVLRTLPPSQPLTHDADAFLLSWEDTGVWNTRVYDRTKLPAEVQELCKQMNIPPTWL